MMKALVESGKWNVERDNFCRRVFSFLLLLSSFLVITSCEKDIDISYRSVDPIYVVEASVSNDGMVARISQTQDIGNNSTTSDISDAKIVVTGSDGSVNNLTYRKNGMYLAQAIGVPGVTYHIDVEIDGQHFTSTSTMQDVPEINLFHFMWKEVMGQRFLVGELLFQDILNQDNWYFTHLYRNGIGYRWAVKRDDQKPNGELQQLFSIARENDDDDKDMLHEGDRLHLELRAIDQRAYDYLYSMQIMGNTGTNPLPNFSGGCLGYFSAYSEVTMDFTYHEADVENE